MNDLQALEKTLAELLGWTNVFVYKSQPGVRGDHPTENLREDLPRWTTDDAAAFQLMCEHDLIVVLASGACVVDFTGYAEAISENYYTHNSKAEAVRVAIVKAVIAKLESTK